MNWITNFVRPKIKALISSKKDIPDNLWQKCPGCQSMLHHQELVKNLNVCHHCNYHLRMDVEDRLHMLFDEGEFQPVELPKAVTDPLKFRDRKKYADRLKEAQGATGRKDAIIVAQGQIGGQVAVIAAFDFSFMGGSMGAAVGDGLITGSRLAVSLKAPFIVIPASGGARMQEGMLSLMQMPRTTVAVQKLRKERLPYIVVLTHPTTGGVTASYAMLGDVHVAEPGALIGFAGPRVIEQTIREQLPEGFQRAEYLLAHGMVDMVVHRHNLRATVSRLARLFMRQAPQAKRELVAAEVVQNAIPRGEPAMAALPSPAKAGAKPIEVKAPTVQSSVQTSVHGFAAMVRNATATATGGTPPASDAGKTKKPS
jgi:acetyl-CoA carboxylase carboxyl transferase subunit beta